MSAIFGSFAESFFGDICDAWAIGQLNQGGQATGRTVRSERGKLPIQMCQRSRGTTGNGDMTVFLFFSSPSLVVLFKAWRCVGTGSRGAQTRACITSQQREMSIVSIDLLDGVRLCT